MLGTPWLRSRSSYQFSLDRRSRIRSGSYLFIIPAFTRCSTHASTFDRRRSGFSGKSTYKRLFPSAWALRWAVERPIAHLFSRPPTIKVVALPHATAIKSRCRAATVAIRVEPGHHLSLFMGRRMLAATWRDVAEWPKEDDACRPVGPIRVGCSKQYVHQLRRHPTCAVLSPLSVTRTG